MSSNQAPETESDIQHLLQAFAEYKQGEAIGKLPKSRCLLINARTCHH